MSSAGTPDPGRAVQLAWRVRGSRPDPHDVADAWMALAAAVACWPAGPVAVERRFVGHGAGRPVIEYVLASAWDAPFFGGDEELATDLDDLTAPLREVVPSSPAPVPSEFAGDVAEVRAVSDAAPEGARVLGQMLDDVVSTLARSEPGTSVGLTVAPPPTGDDDLLAAGGATNALMLRPVRCRLRLAAPGRLRPPLLARAGALVLRPQAVGGTGWHRGRARPGDDAEPVVSTFVAGLLLGLQCTVGDEDGAQVRRRLARQVWTNLLAAAPLHEGLEPWERELVEDALAALPAGMLVDLIREAGDPAGRARAERHLEEMIDHPV